MNRIQQPEGSSLCGQACVAMAAGVSLDRSIEIIGHSHGTWTRDVIRGLRALGVGCADRLHRVSRKMPVLPRRCLVAVQSPRRKLEHWMLSWDGVMLDPAGRWPALQGWTITSYLEINT